MHAQVSVCVCVCVCTCLRACKILLCMKEFGGLWKTTKPAWTRGKWSTVTLPKSGEQRHTQAKSITASEHNRQATHSLGTAQPSSPASRSVRSWPPCTPSAARRQRSGCRLSRGTQSGRTLPVCTNRETPAWTQPLDAILEDLEPMDSPCLHVWQWYRMPQIEPTVLCSPLAKSEPKHCWALSRSSNSKQKPL